jgi:hypothetical protein
MNKIFTNVWAKLFGIFFACFTLCFCFAKVEQIKTLDYNPVPTINNSPGRTLNTSFQPTCVRGTFVSYTIVITRALNLGNLTASGVANLQISPDNVNWTTINSAGITSTLSVSLSLGITDALQYNIQGVVPKGYYARIQTNVSGGASVTMPSGQETYF